ncbi:hypothetical protein [Haladaptatus sp. W1]|uniref:hypothetical protein n=1 Tax=Haladaptatus sp. W1 TaxID=1897478 RepID=UPI0020C75923|nr:hypothetical protein [Haladaptatus sp. W1]
MPHERPHRPADRTPPARRAPRDTTLVSLFGLTLLGMYGLILAAAPVLGAVVVAFSVIPTISVVGPYVVVRVVTLGLERGRDARQPIRTITGLSTDAESRRIDD